MLTRLTCEKASQTVSCEMDIKHRSEELMDLFILPSGLLLDCESELVFRIDKNICNLTIVTTTINNVGSGIGTTTFGGLTHLLYLFPKPL